MNIPINDKLKAEMNLMNQRTQVLSGNIADINTPNRKAKDIDPKALEGKKASFSNQIKLARTSPHHVDHITTTAAQAVRVVEDKTNRKKGPNGNNMVLEDQLEKIDETQMRFKTATTMFRKHHDMLRSIARK